jgi:hypothetical protein
VIGLPCWGLIVYIDEAEPKIALEFNGLNELMPTPLAQFMDLSVYSGSVEDGIVFKILDHLCLGEGYLLWSIG